MTRSDPAFAAADRNKDAILEVLREVLPETGTVLEVASGGGQHVLHFSAALPGLTWQPSDRDPHLVAALAGDVAVAAHDNLRPPLQLDVSVADWASRMTGPVDAVISANMIHIAPWQASVGLFRGAADLVGPDGLVFFYGPFIVDGAYTSPGNEAFDRSLRGQNPDWGLRSLDEMRELAREFEFDLARTIDRPVHNLAVVFRRRAKT